MTNNLASRLAALEKMTEPEQIRAFVTGLTQEQREILWEVLTPHCDSRPKGLNEMTDLDLWNVIVEGTQYEGMPLPTDVNAPRKSFDIEERKIS